MPRNLATGVFTRVSNSFSDPVANTVIDPDDADELFDDYDQGLSRTVYVDNLAQNTFSFGSNPETALFAGTTDCFLFGWGAAKFNATVVDHSGALGADAVMTDKSGVIVLGHTGLDSTATAGKAWNNFMTATAVSGAGTTLTAAAVAGGMIIRSGGSADATDTLPTAALMVDAGPGNGAPVCGRELVYVNNDTWGYTLALGSGWTNPSSTSLVIPPGASARFAIKLTNTGSGTEAATITRLDAGGGQGTAIIDTYSAPGADIWTKRTGATIVEVYCVGGGGGGGAGARFASGTATSGGAGGGGGGLSRATFRASNLSATESILVGAGGAGGAAVTVNDAVGPNGSAGVTSVFGTGGSRVRAANGAGGQGGQNGGASTGGTGGAAMYGGTAGGAGANGIGGNAGVTPTSSAAPTGGGAGAGMAAAPADANGGDGGAMSAYRGTGATGGIPLNAPAAGSTVAASALPGLGGGGGGGYCLAGGTAVAGADGGIGGGGGGGGSSVNGNNSGAGGAGGSGVVVVITYFD